MKRKEDILVPENKDKENDSEDQKKMVSENEESTSKDAANNENSDLGNMEENQEENNGTLEPEPIKTLTAVHPILYLSHQYKIGDELPANDPKMVEAWLTAGTAIWRLSSKVPVVKAKAQTAEPGLFGQAVPSGDNDLIGRIPVRGRWR